MSRHRGLTSEEEGIWPALGLMFAAPLVAEFLLGNLPIKLLPALIVLAPMYGGGALLIREMVRRTGRGWPSILLLGMAYGIFEEAFTTQSLFNPNYLKLNLGLLTPAYIPSLGIGAWWTLWMLMVHGIWSISTPIALVEACVPDRARTPWLGRVGLVVVAMVFLFGACANTAIGYKQDHYLASMAQFVGAAVVIVLLVASAFLIPQRREMLRVPVLRHRRGWWARLRWYLGRQRCLFPWIGVGERWRRCLRWMRRCWCW